MPHWTDEENEKLKRMLSEQSRDNGNVVHGFYIKASKEFNRHPESIRRHANYLMKSGKFPYATQRSDYLPLDITEAEAGWLAGILDGEGTIPSLEYKHGSRKYTSWQLPCNSIRVVLVYNSDISVIEKAAKLVPFAKVSAPYRKGMATKDMRFVSVNGSRNVFVTLTRLLPYMAETRKIERAQAIINRIRVRVESIDPWRMTPILE